MFWLSNPTSCFEIASFLGLKLEFLVFFLEEFYCFRRFAPSGGVIFFVFFARFARGFFGGGVIFGEGYRNGGQEGTSVWVDCFFVCVPPPCAPSCLLQPVWGKALFVVAILLALVAVVHLGKKRSPSNHRKSIFKEFGLCVLHFGGMCIHLHPCMHVCFRRKDGLV